MRPKNKLRILLLIFLFISCVLFVFFGKLQLTTYAILSSENPELKSILKFFIILSSVFLLCIEATGLVELLNPIKMRRKRSSAKLLESKIKYLPKEIKNIERYIPESIDMGDTIQRNQTGVTGRNVDICCYINWYNHWNNTSF